MAGKTAYKNNWQKENMDRVNLTMPKGWKEVVKAHAEENGQSVNSYINEAIAARMENAHADHLWERRIRYALSKYGLNLTKATNGGYVVKGKEDCASVAEDGEETYYETLSKLQNLVEYLKERYDE